MCLNVVHSLPALDDTLVLTVLEYMYMHSMKCFAIQETKLFGRLHQQLVAMIRTVRVRKHLSISKHIHRVS